MARYGYVRVSTVGQSKHGNGLEAQVNQLMAEGVDQRLIFTDAYTGAKIERPEFSRLCKLLQAGDSLVVTKLDRFARSVREGLDIIDELIKRGVRIHILNMGVLDNTPTSRLIRAIFLAFAEFERDMIMERTYSGKELARQRPGYKEGRPRSYNSVRLDYAISMLQSHSMSEVVRATGISESTLYREIRRRRSP